MKMLKLMQINALTSYHDGSIYSDLFKDVYGSRPCDANFESVESFYEDMEFLSKQWSKHQDDEVMQQEENWTDFVYRVEDTMEIVKNCDRKGAIAIIADAEGETERVAWYGYERLEYLFTLKYGSIQKWLDEEVE